MEGNIGFAEAIMNSKFSISTVSPLVEGGGSIFQLLGKKLQQFSVHPGYQKKKQRTKTEIFNHKDPGMSFKKKRKT